MSTRDYLMGPRITESQHMELIHPKMNTPSALAVTLQVDIVMANNIKGIHIIAASIGVGCLCVSFMDKSRPHRKS